MKASSMLLAGVVVMLSSFAGSISHAALLTFAYEGTVDATFGFPDSAPFDAFLGKTLRVEYTFETTTPDNNPSSNGDYLGAVTAAEIAVGSNVYTATGGNIIIIDNGVNPDQYIVDVLMGLAGPAVGGLPPVRFEVIFSDTTNTFFSSDALPTVQPDPSGFTAPVLQFTFQSPSLEEVGIIQVLDAVISEPASIPVMSPAGLLVFAAGLLGFIGYYRRRF